MTGAELCRRSHTGINGGSGPLPRAAGPNPPVRFPTQLTDCSSLCGRRVPEYSVENRVIRMRAQSSRKACL